MIKLRLQDVVALCGSFLTACADMPGSGDLELVEEPIINGAPIGTLPGVGVYGDVFNNLCSATLVAPRLVMTAGHCTRFSPSLLGKPTFNVGNGTDSAGGAQYNVQTIFNFGPSGFNGGDLNQWTKSHVHTTTDFSGNDDIALVLLAQPVPASVATPLPIAEQATPPPLFIRPLLVPQPNMTTWGYGCSTIGGSEFGVKRYFNWVFRLNTGAGSSAGDLIDPNGNLVRSTQIKSADLPTGGKTCSGDSGGPTFIIPPTSPDSFRFVGGTLWGVVSLGNLGSSDTFGAVAFLRKPICNTVYNNEPHSVCTAGDRLIEPPVGCASSQSSTDRLRGTDATIHQICDSTDPYCCDVSWDTICVKEAKVLANCSI